MFSKIVEQIKTSLDKFSQVILTEKSEVSSLE